jgi:hypothetical protein
VPEGDDGVGVGSGERTDLHRSSLAHRLSPDAQARLRVPSIQLVTRASTNGPE